MNTSIGDSSSLLKISNSEYLVKFLNVCVDDWIGRKHADFDTYNSDVEWTKAEMQRACDFIQNLYKRAILDELSSAKVFEPEIAELSTKDLEEIKYCFNVRKDDIYQAVVKEKLSQSEKPLLENFDWKLKWAMGSSSLASMSSPLLQMDFRTGKERINFEADLKGLEKLISELESAKNGLQ